MIKPRWPITSPFLLFTILTIISACHKTAPPVDSNFYISFTAGNSNYLYKQGQNAQYFRGGTSADNFGNFFIDPSTYMSPLQTNLNIYLAGFVFDYQTYLSSLTIPFTSIGDTLFATRSYGLCNTGVGFAYNGEIGAFACPLRSDVGVVAQAPNGTLYTSVTSIQPAGSFYIIDSIVNAHYVDNDNLRDYDKIITGRFQCRVFDPVNSSIYLDLTNGKFRMPVWRNAQDGL